MAVSIDYLWKDRKRYFGLPISFTKYRMSDDRLFLTTGIITTHDEEVILYRVRDIHVSITLGQRIFGVGTVTVMSADKTMPTLELKNVKNPREVKEMIHKQVEEMKIKRRMRVGEILGDNMDNDDFDNVYDNDDLDDEIEQ